MLPGIEADSLSGQAIGLRWQRVTQRAQFNAVLSAPPVAKTAHFALHAMAVADSATRDLFVGHGPWIGVLIPKRWAKRAVTRNAIRRQIYAVSQDCAQPWARQAVVVRLRSGFARQHFPSATSEALRRAVRTELLRLFPGARGE